MSETRKTIDVERYRLTDERKRQLDDKTYREAYVEDFFTDIRLLMASLSEEKRKRKDLESEIEGIYKDQAGASI